MSCLFIFRVRIDAISVFLAEFRLSLRRECGRPFARENLEETSLPLLFFSVDSFTWIVLEFCSSVACTWATWPSRQYRTMDLLSLGQVEKHNSLGLRRRGLHNTYRSLYTVQRCKRRFSEFSAVSLQRRLENPIFNNELLCNVTWTEISCAKSRERIFRLRFIDPVSSLWASPLATIDEVQFTIACVYVCEFTALIK